MAGLDVVGPRSQSLVRARFRIARGFHLALGRRNYLFCGSDEGAQRAATIYTVLATCKLTGVEPWAYPNDVMPKLAKWADGDDVSALLPATWKAARAVTGEALAEAA